MCSKQGRAFTVTIDVDVNVNVLVDVDINNIEDTFDICVCVSIDIDVHVDVHIKYCPGHICHLHRHKHRCKRINLASMFMSAALLKVDVHVCVDVNIIVYATTQAEPALR